MAGIQLSNLVSGSFDWQSIVDQLIAVDSTPITTLQTNATNNNTKLASLAELKSDLSSLQGAATALKADGLFTGRVGSSSASDSGWTIDTASSATVGTYAVNVTRLATAAQRQGAADISAALSATADVTGLTVANLATATAVTAGNFTVNGQTIAVATTDTLDQVFQKIHAATGQVVTASYDPGADGITLQSNDGSEVLLGAANDTSNFLAVMQLANNAGSSVSSAAALGAVALNSPLASARLRGAITAVDGSGNGSFSLNGVALAYNVNTDSLSTIISRINASTAGVTARYDSATDAMVLTNATTGDIGLGANEAAGGLLSALGLATGSTFTHGQNAQFTVNGGPTRSSASNTLGATALGVQGLAITANTTGAQTISVAANTSAMQSAIVNFVNAFNTVQTFIDSETAISTTAAGAVSTNTLSGDHDVQDWGTYLRTIAFNAVGGLTGTVSRLNDLGIDFKGTSSTLQVTDESKLTAALANHSDDVAAFFTKSTTGFSDVFNNYLTQVLSSTGGLAAQTNTLNSQNTGITAQIAVLKTRVAAEKDQLTTAFLAMQNAQSVASQQSSLLTQTFSPKSSS